MLYMLLLYEDERLWEGKSEAEQAADLEVYMGLDATFPGRVLAGEALQPVATATSVRVRDGKVTLTDGPFAETREQLGGFYLIEAADLDEARAMAAKIPAARGGCVEIRPVMVYG